MANRVAKLFNKKYSNLLLHWGLFFYSPHSEIKEQKIQRKNGYIHHLKIFSTWEQIPKLCWRWRYLWREIKWERNQAGKECFWTTIYNADLITLKREMKKQDEVESTLPTPDGSAILKVLPVIQGPQREYCSLEKFFIHQKRSSCSARNSGQTEFWYECCSGSERCSSSRSSLQRILYWREI